VSARESPSGFDEFMDFALVMVRTAVISHLLVAAHVSPFGEGWTFLGTWAAWHLSLEFAIRVRSGL